MHSGPNWTLSISPEKVYLLQGESLSAVSGHAFLEPFIDVVLESFGEERVLFCSDWPVALLASSYRRWYETLETLTAHLPVSGRRKLWAGNARRFYRMS